MSRQEQIQTLETRIAGLKANIARRESQAGNKPSEGVYVDVSKHVAAARKELRDLAAELVGLKFDPLAVIERMTAPPPEPVVVTREPTDADVRAKLNEFLTRVPPTTTAAELTEFVST